ncbi:MAG: divergent polysaccharide deacetylase family protein [Candidatus Omnitrophica bacterium]|nr:divergent polysaccharide deacetylase family protein [Candidatus Omnitrophota bacterium]
MNRKLVIISVLILSFLVFVAVILTAVHKRILPKAALIKGKIAIVIDDWGYNLSNLKDAGEIKQPLTCAVLPNLNNSALVARKLNSFGFEIILHLPMEPKEKYRLEKNTITTTMDALRIRSILDQDLASVLFAKGISNHMGSRITENSRVSALIISEVKRRKLYFLDSFVTAKSVCSLLAAKMKVRFAKRDIFLDNRDDPAYIKAQIFKLRDLAKKKGQAIGIGHDRRNTLAVLKEVIPQMVKDGYKFVFVSEIAK